MRLDHISDMKFVRVYLFICVCVFARARMCVHTCVCVLFVVAGDGGDDLSILVHG